MKNRIRIAWIAVLAALSLDAAAQNFIEVDSVSTLIGVGVAVVPDYQGSDDKTAGIAPYARYTIPGSQRYVQILANELQVNLIDSKNLRIGPLLNYRFGRNDDVDDDVVKRMAGINPSLEAGVFAEYAWIDSNPRNRFILGGAIWGNDGYRARVTARYWQQVSNAIDLHLGAGLVYADSKYTDKYFGVNAGNVGASGLPFFNAGGGLNEYFMTVGAVVYFSRDWLGGIGARIAKLAGDAKDSPIVSLRGDSTQVIGGGAIAYVWR